MLLLLLLLRLRLLLVGGAILGLELFMLVKCGAMFVNEFGIGAELILPPLLPRWVPAKLYIPGLVWLNKLFDEF